MLNQQRFMQLITSQKKKKNNGMQNETLKTEKHI